MRQVLSSCKTSSKKPEVSDKQAEEAFKTILKWIGEDPNREGLVETPKRVIKAFKEYNYKDSYFINYLLTKIKKRNSLT